MNISNIIIILFFGIAISSCNEKPNEDIVLKCFNDKEQEQLTELKKSFNKFLETNYKSSREDFLTDLIHEKQKDYIFKKSDSTLIVRLHRDSFLNISNYHITVEKRYQDLEEPRRSQFIEKNKDREFWYFDYSKNYLTCLNSIPKKDSLTIQYLKVKTIVGGLSTYVLSNNLLTSLNKNHKKAEEILDYILIVEFYYYILIKKLKEKS